MKHIACTIVIALSIISTAGWAGEEPLTLFAFISDSDEAESHLSLWITNRGDTPQTVRTEGFSQSGGKNNGHRMPSISFDYRLLTIGPHDGKTWKFVPSLPGACTRDYPQGGNCNPPDKP